MCWGGITFYIMPSKPLKSILDREIGVVESNLSYSDLIRTAEDVVNYGTNLIARSYEQSNAELIDTILIHNFLKNIVSLLDSLSELCKKGCHLTVPYLARGVIENTFYISWVLKKNSIRRAEYFYVFQLIEELSTASRMYQNPDYYHQLFKKSGLDGLEDLNEITPIAKDRVSQIKNHLEKHFSNLYRRFKDESPAKWYSINNGPNSIKVLASEIENDSEYEIFYRGYSKVIHSSDLKHNMEISKKGGRIVPIRGAEKLHEVLITALTFTFRSYRIITKKYIPSELELFRKVYITDWKKSFTSSKE